MSLNILCIKINKGLDKNHSFLLVDQIDQFIVSQELLTLVTVLLLKNQRFFSDHYQLICWLNLLVPKTSETINQPNIVLKPSIFQNSSYGINPLPYLLLIRRNKMTVYYTV